MANTELITTQTVGGNQDFGPFAIEYIDITDIKVSLDGVLQTLTTEYTIDSATSTVTFVTAPDVGAVIRIFRETPIETAKAILAPGSSIRAQNLNDNTEQALFAVQEIKTQYVTRSSGEFDTDVDLNDNRITNLADPTDPQDAVTKQYLEDNYFDDDTETILSSEAWPDNDTTIATTAAIDDRVDAKIDSAITGDIGTDGTGITITNDGDGTITLGLGAGSIDFDRIKDVDIITQAEQNAGSPAAADTNLFTALAAARRFDTLVQTGTPSDSNYQVGKTWLQNDDNLTLSVWNGSAWLGIASGGTFTNQPKVVYVDATAGDDNNNGHRISRPKQTIKAAIAQINSDATYGDGSVVVVAPGVYQEEAPIQIQKKNVSIIGQALRSCIVHPTSATETNTLFELNSGSYVANLTLTGIKAGTGTGNTVDATLPTDQGWNFAFLSGATITKSPYIQNCTNFSDSEIDNDDLNAVTPAGGAAGDTDSAPTGGGLLVNGATVDSDSPLRSMVCDSYTHVGLNGPGILVTNNGYVQATSSYAFFNKYHIKCLNGGQANLAASTTDFGDQALVADGKSTTNIFTADCVTAVDTSGAAVTTIRVSNGNADASWHGSSTRPQTNMLLAVNSEAQVYPILQAVPQDQATYDADPAAYTGDWIVTISRPNPSNRSENLGFSANVSTGTDNVQFFLRSMIASSGHTMEYVGSGTDYRALPENGGVPDETKQITESNNGKVWTAITDHNGKFKIGGNQTDDPIFEIDQQLGFVTIPEGSIAFNLLSDETPQLGGNLDVNGNTITSTSNANVVIDPDGTGTVDVSTSRITSVTDPTGAQDAATKNYVDTELAGYVSQTATTGSAEVPSGTEAERDGSPSAGYLRFNTDVNQFEGYNGTSWASVGGGATGAGGDQWALEHDNTITTSYTITSGKNVITAGPMTINSGVTVTVPTGSNWVIV